MKTQYEFSEAEQPFLECETFRLRIWTPYSRAPRAGVKPWSRWRGLKRTEWGSCPTPTSKKGRHRAATALTATPSNAPKRPILSQLHRRAEGNDSSPPAARMGKKTARHCGERAYATFLCASETPRRDRMIPLRPQCGPEGRALSLEAGRKPWFSAFSTLSNMAN